MCLLLMKQKLYALDAFFIEKLKLSENDPPTEVSLAWLKIESLILHKTQHFWYLKL